MQRYCVSCSRLNTIQVSVSVQYFYSDFCCSWLTWLFRPGALVSFVEFVRELSNGRWFYFFWLRRFYGFFCFSVLDCEGFNFFCYSLIIFCEGSGFSPLFFFCCAMLLFQGHFVVFGSRGNEIFSSVLPFYYSIFILIIIVFLFLFPKLWISFLLTFLRGDWSFMCETHTFIASRCCWRGIGNVQFNSVHA